MSIPTGSTPGAHRTGPKRQGTRAGAGAEEHPTPLRRRRRRACPRIPALLIALLAACGDATGLPDASKLVIPIEGVVTVTGTENVLLYAEGRTDDDSPAALDPDSVTWSVSAPDVAELVEPSGDTVTLRATAAYGFTWVHARGPGSLHDSIGAWVQPPATQASSFTITLVFTDSVIHGWETQLTAAAQMWEGVIRLPLPLYELDTGSADSCLAAYPPDDEPPERVVRQETGVVIQVATSAEAFGGQDTPRAASRPCLQRPMPRPTSAYGLIVLNRLALPPSDPAAWRYAAAREIGHALGLVGLFLDTSPPWFDAAQGSYRGVLGLEGYRRTWGDVQNALAVQYGEWVTQGDVLSRDFTPQITDLTIGALMDMGYPAAWYDAGPQD